MLRRCDKSLHRCRKDLGYRTARPPRCFWHAALSYQRVGDGSHRSGIPSSLCVPLYSSITDTLSLLKGKLGLQLWRGSLPLVRASMLPFAQIAKDTSVCLPAASRGPRYTLQAVTSSDHDAILVGVSGWDSRLRVGTGCVAGMHHRIFSAAHQDGIAASAFNTAADKP